VRARAAWTLFALGELGNARAVGPLIKALGDENLEVRAGAAWTLGKIWDARAVDPLIKLLGDESSGVREAAVWALGEIKDRRAVDPLIKALEDGISKVREAAAWALGKIRDARAVDPLIKLLGDENSDVRQAVSSVLGEIKDRRAVDPLINTLRDKNSKVREAAARALGEIGDKGAVDPLLETLIDEVSDVRQTAATALEKLGELLGQLIYEGLKGSQKAMEELLRRKDPRPIELFINTLNHQDSEMRRAAAWGLGEIKDARALDGLVRMAGGWNLLDRIIATTALAKIEQGSDYFFTALRVLACPASVGYVFCLMLLGFSTYKMTRWSTKVIHHLRR
jgi:HEAT repeat protein